MRRGRRSREKEVLVRAKVPPQRTPRRAGPMRQPPAPFGGPHDSEALVEIGRGVRGSLASTDSFGCEADADKRKEPTQAPAKIASLVEKKSGAGCSRIVCTRTSLRSSHPSDCFRPICQRWRHGARPSMTTCLLTSRRPVDARPWRTHYVARGSAHSGCGPQCCGGWRWSWRCWAGGR